MMMQKGLLAVSGHCSVLLSMVHSVVFMGLRDAFASCIHASVQKECCYSTQEGLKMHCVLPELLCIHNTR